MSWSIFYTILNVFPKREKLKYLKYIRLRLQDHNRSFEHASVYRINSIQDVGFIMDYKEMSWWQLSFAQHYQLTLATSMSLVCVYKKYFHLPPSNHPQVCLEDEGAEIC